MTWIVVTSSSCSDDVEKGSQQKLWQEEQHREGVPGRELAEPAPLTTGPAEANLTFKHHRQLKQPEGVGKARPQQHNGGDLPLQKAISLSLPLSMATPFPAITVLLMMLPDSAPFKRFVPKLTQSLASQAMGPPVPTLKPLTPLPPYH